MPAFQAVKAMAESFYPSIAPELKPGAWFILRHDHNFPFIPGVPGADRKDVNAWIGHG